MVRSEPNVRLTPLSVEHLPHVMTWVNDREVLQYFANLQDRVSEEDERRYLDHLVKSPNDKAFSIFDGETYVGQCSINHIYWPARHGRIFMVIRKEQQRNGYGGAALRALFRIAFDELNMHKLWCIVRRDNRQAQRLYLDVGMDFEGVLRDEYFVAGRFHDMVIMSILSKSPAR
jgi:diamine N-acetyltransferase